MTPFAQPFELHKEAFDNASSNGMSVESVEQH